MELNNKKLMQTSKIYKWIGVVGSLSIGLIFFLFSLLSGAEAYGGGLIGILKNSPNSLPWLLVIIFSLIGWKWNLTGGVLITLAGISAFVFFFLLNPIIYIELAFLFGVLTLSGVSFLLSWKCTKRSSK